jgi:RNA polymerase sigma factor (sigma-70 family)
VGVGLDGRAIARVFDGFRAGAHDEVSLVRAWIDSVVRAGRWRFADPEGVAQEVLLTIHTLARSGKLSEPRAFQKLVYVVARHRCVSQYRRERVRARHEVPEDGTDVASSEPSPDEAIIRREERVLALHVVHALPAPCRLLCRWVYSERLAAAEVGARLGISAGTARVRIHRCLRAAREAYGRAAGADGPVRRPRGCSTCPLAGAPTRAPRPPLSLEPSSAHETAQPR